MQDIESFGGLTTAYTLRRGERAGRGTDGVYYQLARGPGEPHLRRLELAPHAPAPERRASLLHFAYVTDLHIVDPESPGRFEFVDRLAGPDYMHLLTPAYRPHEFMQLHACEAMLRTMNAVAGSPLTGAPVQFHLCTGDYTDNAQLNELRWALGLLEGATIAPPGAGRAYEGVASAAWGDDAYWRPDAPDDDYRRRWGFPVYPDLLDTAARPFTAHGAARPWLSCFGNHDSFIQGTARFTPAFERLLTGDRKARALPAGFDLPAYLDRYIAQPEELLAGPAAQITPDPARRHYTRHELLRAHLEARGEPAGHGFSARNLDGGTAYYADDSHPGVRLIALDTVNPGGNYHGGIGAAQLAWLEERLIEVHARYWDSDGRAVETGNTDRLVVILSHHGLSTLVNDLVAPEGEQDLPRALGPQVEALLHRFPNVVLWVNGHTHRNAVRPRPDPAGRSSGFWEVTTSSLLDWPCQARLVELIDNGNGTLSVLCTMVDHAAPADPAHADPAHADGLMRLAALHRELAANDPHCGIAGGNQGQPADRNVELVLPAPFPLVRE